MAFIYLNSHKKNTWETQESTTGTGVAQYWKETDSRIYCRYPNLWMLKSLPKRPDYLNITSTSCTL